MHESLCKVNLVPSQADQFRYPEPMTIGDQDQSGVTKAVAPLRTRGVDDLADLFSRQIFPVAILGIRLSNGNFPFYDSWSSGGGVFARPGFLGRGPLNLPHLSHYIETPPLQDVLQAESTRSLCAPSTRTLPLSPK